MPSGSEPDSFWLFILETYISDVSIGLIPQFSGFPAYRRVSRGALEPVEGGLSLDLTPHGRRIKASPEHRKSRAAIDKTSLLLYHAPV